jgi:hypothetical protein
MSESKMFTGDVFTCQKQLSGLLKCNNAGDAATVERVHIMLSKFTNESFIPVEYAEKLLTSVGNLMERCSDEDVLVNFASNIGFTTLLISIISDFTMRIAPTSPMKSISPSSFSSHYCYELSLFMLLGLLDKTKVLKVFVRTVTPSRIENLISSVCSIITRDQLYLTQVIVFGVLLQSSLNSFYPCSGSRAGERVPAGTLPAAARRRCLPQGHEDRPTPLSRCNRAPCADSSSVAGYAAVPEQDQRR